MLRRRAKLPVLAEIAGPAEGTRAWSLRREDFAALETALPRLVEQSVVLVSGEGEATSVAAIALATVAVSAGRRTILVECDLAEPRLAAQIGLAAAPGLHEYLRWEAGPADVIQPVALGGPAAGGSTDPLVCVCAGRPAQKVETLLGLQSFAHMVGKLRGAYELVILAGPSGVDEPEPCAAAAQQADAVIAAFGDGDDRSTRKAIGQLPALALGAVAVG